MSRVAVGVAKALHKYYFDYLLHRNRHCREKFASQGSLHLPAEAVAFQTADAAVYAMDCRPIYSDSGSDFDCISARRDYEQTFNQSLCSAVANCYLRLAELTSASTVVQVQGLEVPFYKRIFLKNIIFFEFKRIFFYKNFFFHYYRLRFQITRRENSAQVAGKLFVLCVNQAHKREKIY